MNGLMFRIQSSLRRCVPGFWRHTPNAIKHHTFEYTSPSMQNRHFSVISRHTQPKKWEVSDCTVSHIDSEPLDWRQKRREVTYTKRKRIGSSIGRINVIALNEGLCSVEDSELRRVDESLRIKGKKPYLADKKFLMPTDDFESLLKLERKILDSDIPMDIEVFDYQVMNNSSHNFAICENWLSYLLDSGRRISIFTYIEYMNSWYMSGELDKTEDKVIEIYNKIKDQVQYLDPHNAERILTVMSKTSIANSVTEEMCSKETIMRAATCTTKPGLLSISIQNKDKPLVRELLSRSIAFDTADFDKIFLTLLEEASKESHLIDVQESFQYLLDVGKEISSSIAVEVVNLINSGALATQCRAALAEVDSQRSVCRNCNRKLEMHKLDYDDFIKVQEAVFEHILVKDNIYFNTNPEEAKVFVEAMEWQKPYDFILDGENLRCFARSADVPIDAVLDRLIGMRPNCRMLMISKKSWSDKSSAQRIVQKYRRNMAVFFADFYSQDDPFIMYAAIKSGHKCQIVSNDMFRQDTMVMCDRDPELGRKFRRYIKSHNMHVRRNFKTGELDFFSNYDPVQRDERGIHAVIKTKNMFNKPVLCLRTLKQK